MDLFNQHPEDQNLLPIDGKLLYIPHFLSIAESDYYFAQLTESIQWRHEKLHLFGKEIVTARKVALYADKSYQYTYSNTTKTAHIWTKELLELKQKIEEKSTDTFNSCLLNLYHNGRESMGWHSDNEKTLVPRATIASLSLGAERTFMFKHQTTKQKIKLQLANGSLLLMMGEIQQHWLHQLPKTTKVLQPRINLTFRTIVA